MSPHTSTSKCIYVIPFKLQSLSNINVWISKSCSKVPEKFWAMLTSGLVPGSTWLCPPCQRMGGIPTLKKIHATLETIQETARESATQMSQMKDEITSEIDKNMSNKLESITSRIQK